MAVDVLRAGEPELERDFAVAARRVVVREVAPRVGEGLPEEDLVVGHAQPERPAARVDVVRDVEPESPVEVERSIEVGDEQADDPKPERAARDSGPRPAPGRGLRGCLAIATARGDGDREGGAGGPEQGRRRLSGAVMTAA